MIKKEPRLKSRTQHRPSVSQEEFNALIIDSIQDVKGQNIVLMDLRELDDAPADFFIVCEGESNVQVRSIGEKIYTRVKAELGMTPLHMEGTQNAHWVCLDFFDTVVHVFYRSTRSFYDLEDLWSDARFTEYQNL